MDGVLKILRHVPIQNIPSYNSSPDCYSTNPRPHPIPMPMPIPTPPPPPASRFHPESPPLPYFWTRSCAQLMPTAHPGASSGASCDTSGQMCSGQCGGLCSACGFGADFDIQIVRLLVADQALFDAAFAVSCGPPEHLNFDFANCNDWTSHGICNPQCTQPYAGFPTAKCRTNGEWEYGGTCDAVATCFMTGFNSNGQLGIRSTHDEGTPQPLHAPNQEAIYTVAVAGWHSAFLTESAAYVMGSNRHGQLGLPVGAGVSYSTPQRLEAPDGAVITAIATGNSHTVFLAGGAMFGMGANRMGQLGLPPAVLWTDTPRPCVAPTGAKIRAVAAGSFHTAFITEAGPDFVPGAGGQYRCIPGVDFAVRLTSDGDPQCMSLDGTQCYEAAGGCAAGLNNRLPKPFNVTCGGQLQELSGITGYEDTSPRHWCYEIRQRLTGVGLIRLGGPGHASGMCAHMACAWLSALGSAVKYMLAREWLGPYPFLNAPL